MNKIYKSVLGVSAAAMTLAATLTPAVVNAWGNSGEARPSYSIEDINNGDLGDKITFNSITDGKIGDEKNFVGAKVAGTLVDTWNANEIEVKDGETYTIRLYVHNNSPLGYDNVAEDVKATFSVPTTVGKSHTIVGYIDSSNATPERYWDEVELKSDEDFYIEYVENSAKYTNSAMGTVALSNDVIISGATLGYEKLDGKIPGCYQYDGVVTIDVKVHKSVAAKVSKVVRVKGTKTWSESVEAKVGDEVEYQIEYVNLLNETVNDVMIRDVLPTNVEYVKDSTYLYNSNYQSGVLLADNDVTTTGINIGSYVTNGNAYVRFTGKVVNNKLACGDNQLVNWASATVKGSVYKDDASVLVNIVCEEPIDPEPTPEPTPEPEPTPKEIVSTGPETVAFGAIGAGSAVTALGYFIASRKKF